MKFKIVVTGLLTAILAVCIFTSYTLINEAKKQTEIQLSQATGIIAVANYVHWYEDLNLDKTEWSSAGDAYLEHATEIWHKIIYSEQYKNKK